MYMYLFALNMRSVFLVLRPITFWHIIHCSLQRPTRKPCCSRETTRCRCKIRYVKFDTYRSGITQFSLQLHGILFTTIIAAAAAATEMNHQSVHWNCRFGGCECICPVVLFQQFPKVHYRYLQDLTLSEVFCKTAGELNKTLKQYE